MASHAKFTIDIGVQIYVCDPRSPWQRGSNENTKGLLRQYFPKRVANFNDYSQADLDAVAAELNGRDAPASAAGDAQQDRSSQSAK